MPRICVECGGQHSTDSCKKSKTTTATCALCVEAVIPRAAKVVTTIKNNIKLSRPTIDLKSHNAMHQI